MRLGKKKPENEEEEDKQLAGKGGRKGTCSSPRFRHITGEKDSPAPDIRF